VSAGERRPAQLLLVFACLFAVVVAAAAVPGVAGPGTEGGGDGRQAEPSDGDGDGGGGGVGIGDIVRWLFGDGGDPPPEPLPPEYEVDVAPEPVPGRTVTVTVTRRGDPVAGAVVAFGDRRVGRTNASGRVTGEVPYTEGELVVRVRPPDGRRAAAALGGTARVGGLGGTTRVGGLGGTARVGGRVAGAPPAALGPGPLGQAKNGSNVTEAYRLPTTARLRVVGALDPGETVTVVARVADDPLPGAAVTANGERVGETNASGAVSVRVPDDGSRRLRLRAERGAVSGERALPIRLLLVRVRPVDPVAVPTRPAVVEARVGEDPAANAPVAVAGERVARTDAGGRARVRLPVDPTAAVVVRSGDRTARRSLLVPYALTGVVVGVPALALLGLGAVGVRRRETVVAGVRRAGRGTLALARWLAGAAVAAGRLCGRLAVSVARGLVRLARWLARLAVRAARWLARVPRRVAAWASPRAALAALLAVPRWLWRLPGRLLGRGRGDEGDEATGGAREAADAAGHRGFAALWRAFARRVAPGAWRRRTPAEVARAAVERGLPAEPVRRATRAFREHEYAPDDLSADERRGAVETLRGLLSETEGEER
jgi:hypothetical protein